MREGSGVSPKSESRKAGRSPKPKAESQSQKSPDVFAFQGAFPLHPCLSLREREKQKPRCDNSKPLPLSGCAAGDAPLPEGEGRVRGNRLVRIPDRVGLLAIAPRSPSLTGERFLRFTFPSTHRAPPLQRSTRTDNGKSDGASMCVRKPGLVREQKNASAIAVGTGGPHSDE